MDSAFNYRLWQRLKESFPDSDTVWYRNTPVGEKKLGTFLSCLSKAINLSKVYTNHSIWATGTSVLSKCMYGPSQVMSVTGPCSALVFTYEIATQKNSDGRVSWEESCSIYLVSKTFDKYVFVKYTCNRNKKSKFNKTLLTL